MYNSRQYLIFVNNKTNDTLKIQTINETNNKKK